MLPWQPSNVGRNKKVMKWTDTTCNLCTSVRKELEYHYLYVHINSSSDQATSDINSVGF